MPPWTARNARQNESAVSPRILPIRGSRPEYSALRARRFPGPPLFGGVTMSLMILFPKNIDTPWPVSRLGGDTGACHGVSPVSPGLA